MASSARLGHGPDGFYVWEAPHSVLTIQLSLKVVQQLAVEHSRATAEGLHWDARGILLGRSTSLPNRTTFIEDFVLMSPFESEEPCTEAEIVCKRFPGGERGRIPVGFFRFQQDGALIPSDADLKISNRLFARPENVTMLIRYSRHRGTEAAYFYRQNGRIHDFVHVFPFDVAKLIAGAAPATRQDPPPPIEWPRMSAPPAAPEPKAVPELAVIGKTTAGIRWWQLLPTAALFTLGTIAAQTALDRNGNPDLGLKVTTLQHQLQIRWDRTAKTIQQAERGEMRITEGEATEVIPIEQRQLLDG